MHNGRCAPDMLGLAFPHTEILLHYARRSRWCWASHPLLHVPMGSRQRVDVGYVISMYEMFETDTDFLHHYLGKDYGNSWRMSGDIANSWASLATIAANAANIAQYAAPGGFNDLDMLQLGNGGLNDNEERAHMGLWAIAKSPLLIGTDLSKVKTATLNLLKNKVSPDMPLLL
jgi:hypothetical protein